jgi:ankyrin repeat protein
LDVVDELINRGADVNAMVKGGSTSLLISAECQWEKVVESLLKAGAQTTCTLMDNATPLHVAIANTETSLHIIQLLLKYDSDPAFVNAGRNMKEGPHNVTALHVAAEVGSGAFIELQIFDSFLTNGFAYKLPLRRSFWQLELISRRSSTTDKLLSFPLAIAVT